MCIIKILIDKGVRAWPQYRRRMHACTQIHMMTGGAAEMKGLRRKRGANSFYWSGISAISDAPQQKSRGRLRDLQPAPPTLSCICVWLHFHYWTAERIIGTTLSTLQELYSSRVRKGAGKITMDPHIQHAPSVLPSGRRYRALSTRTTRHRNSMKCTNTMSLGKIIYILSTEGGLFIS